MPPGWAVLFLSTFVSGLILCWSWEPDWLTRKGFWVFHHLAFLVFVLLEVAGAFLMTGRSGAPEVRNRMSAFAVAVVVAWVAGATCVNMWVPIMSISDVPWALAWRRITHGVAWGFQPIMAGIAVHSALYTVQEIPRLRANLRNAIAAYFVVLVLAIGLSALAPVMWITHRALQAGSADFEEVPVLWTLPDLMTQRFMAECPGDYHFVLLRANFLWGRGRRAEAYALYNQLRANTNAPETLKRWIDTELANQYQDTLR